MVCVQLGHGGGSCCMHTCRCFVASRAARVRCSQSAGGECVPFFVVLVLIAHAPKHARTWRLRQRAGPAPFFLLHPSSPRWRRQSWRWHAAEH
jgi:hypothetical protein